MTLFYGGPLQKKEKELKFKKCKKLNQLKFQHY